VELILATGSDNLFVQYDIYHMQRMEGELANTLKANLSLIGHVQLADNPGRGEPGTGEINYRYLFNWLEDIGYAAGSAANTSRRPGPAPAWAGSRNTDCRQPEHMTAGFHFLEETQHGKSSSAWASWAHPWRTTCRRAATSSPARPENPPAPLAGGRCHARRCRSGAARRHHHRHGAGHPARTGGAVRREGRGRRLSPGKIVVDMSSISPIATKEFAQKINALGCQYLDAPVSGGEVGAKAASLTIMVGGSESAFNDVKPLFELMGKNITLVGGNGDGQTTKVANQIIVALNIQAVAEALLFASKAGADPARVRAGADGRLCPSRILEVHGERMVKRTFDPGFRIELHQKDLNLALQGQGTGHQLPNTAAAQELFNAAATAGGLDHSALCRRGDHVQPRDRQGFLSGRVIHDEGLPGQALAS
jgi:2-hydroxy-3-oxopropionate reductase